MRGAWIALMVLAASLAGCSAPTDPTSSPTSTPGGPGEGAQRPEHVFIARAEPAPVPSLSVQATFSQRWLKPFGTFDVASVAPPGVRTAWFVEHEEVEPRATVVDGEVYVLKSTTPDHHMPDTRRTRADLDAFAPDGRARALRVEVSGRYVLEAAGARLIVNAWPDAPLDAPAQSFLFEDEAGKARFEPAEIDVATGGRMLLWNEARRSSDLREVAFAAHVPLAPHGGRVTPIDEGLYHMVLVARDASGARGSVREPFLVDFERPSERLHAGPATGRFFVGEASDAPAADAPYGLAFGAQHPLRSLVVRFNASSLAPAPASVEVTLTHEDVPVATMSTLTGSEMVFADMPAGSYDIVVRPEHGVAVVFEVSATGLYVLPTPERLRAAMT